MIGLLTVASIGLGSIVHDQPALHLLLKATGSLYFGWLAWKIAHAGPPELSSHQQGGTYGFRTGLVSTLLSPKGWTMALSAAAGYTALASSAPQRAMLLSLIFCLLMIPNWALWCSGCQALARVLRPERHWQVANTALGVLVVASLIPIWME